MNALLGVSKYKLYVSKNGEALKEEGYVLAFSSIDDVVVSSRYLHKDTDEKYFLKANDPDTIPQEFFVVQEIVSGDFPNDPAPHAFQIKLESQVEDGN